MKAQEPMVFGLKVYYRPSLRRLALIAGLDSKILCVPRLLCAQYAMNPTAHCAASWMLEGRLMEVPSGQLVLLAPWNSTGLLVKECDRVRQGGHRVSPACLCSPPSFICRPSGCLLKEGSHITKKSGVNFREVIHKHKEKFNVKWPPNINEEPGMTCATLEKDSRALLIVFRATSALGLWQLSPYRRGGLRGATGNFFGALISKKGLRSLTIL
ncbi:uncharacterized protein LOC110350225 [Heterocephalus glaber]|uniref:Uncharacterized protein LOC110350225 n=1 Tax=Heterocephalus glaber TaxID=10181 RepID=A0AAX6T8P7_HETGA|nr:uncharacterized protein LOC110350225 [Heterocephalus glaber]